MTNILDYLKAKGVDTSKLTKNSTNMDQDSDSETPEVLPAAVPGLSPSPSDMPVVPTTGPAMRDGRPSISVDTGPFTDSVSTPPIFDPQTHQQLLAAGMNGPASGLAQTPAPASVTDDEDDSEDGKGGSAKVSRSVSIRGGKGDSDHQAMQDALNGGFSNNTVEGLKAAQEKAKSDTNLDSIFRAIGNISGGLAGLGAKTKAPDQTDNNKFYDLQDKAALQGVTDFKDAGEQEKNDPKSAISVNARRVLALAGKSMGFTIPDNMSAAQAELFFPKLSAMSTAKDNREAKSQDLAVRLATLAAINDKKKEGKVTEKQNKDYSTTMDQVSNFRGAQNVGKASEALRNSDMAMAIIKNAKDGDYNNLNDTQYNLLTAEVGKIATGGAATEAAVHDSRAQSLESKAAKFWQEVSGKPTGAQLGEFVKQNQDYLTHLNEVNHELVDNFQTTKLMARYDGFTDDQKQKALLQLPRVASRLGISQDQLSDPNFRPDSGSNLLRAGQKLKAHAGSNSLTTPSGYPRTVVNKSTGKQASVSNPTEEKEAKEHGFE